MRYDNIQLMAILLQTAYVSGSLTTNWISDEYLEFCLTAGIEDDDKCRKKFIKLCNKLTEIGLFTKTWAGSDPALAGKRRLREWKISKDALGRVADSLECLQELIKEVMR